MSTRGNIYVQLLSRVQMFFQEICATWLTHKLNIPPTVHLTTITPDQATQLVNLAIRTQDHELANFARYCQSVAATSGVAVEPAPGKILQGIEKGRAELLTQGRTRILPRITHTSQ